MEPFIADLIKDPKIPKPIRYLIVVALSAAIIFIGIICALNSPFFWGRIFGIILAATFFCLGIYICAKIFRDKPDKPEQPRKRRQKSYKQPRKRHKNHE